MKFVEGNIEIILTNERLVLGWCGPMRGEYCHLVPAEVDGDDGDTAAVGVARPGRLHQPPAGQGARLRHLRSVVTPPVI